MLDLSRLFPECGVRYSGPKLPFYFLFAVAAVSTARSLIHILAPDGGAGSIAGLALDGGAGRNIVAIFAQWGAVQLLLAGFYWLAILRYRFLTPLMLLAFFAEQVLRLAAGHLKPIEAASAPPGALATTIMLPIGLFMVLWSLRKESGKR